MKAYAVLYSILVLFGIPTHGVLANPISALEQKVNLLCSTSFSNKPIPYKENFNDSFVAKITEQDFISITSQVTKQHGTCSSFSVTKYIENRGRALLETPLGFTIVIDLWLADDGKISGFLLPWIEITNIRIESDRDATAFLSSLPGHAALSTVSEGQEKLSYRSQEIQPIGSAFKLYVLGALADAVASGQFSWKDTFPIRDSLRSIPSGEMQDPLKWPTGTPVSLLKFAENMIRISDNTATDHLINILGKQTIEAQLDALGNSIPAKNKPFLNTAELTKLKLTPQKELVERFLRASESGRRELLESEISAIPISSLDPTSWTKPRLTNELEWFASPADLCRAMSRLTAKDDKNVLQAMGLNTIGLPTGEGTPWQYVGFQGGSEPGVVTGTLLLKSQAGIWTCIAGAWHNANDNVDGGRFLDFLRKVATWSSGRK